MGDDDSEEGARFPISMVASGVWAGRIPLERAHAIQEVGGGKQTMRQELGRIGYLGDMEASYKAMPIGVRQTLDASRSKVAEWCRHTLNCTLVSRLLATRLKIPTTTLVSL